MASLNIESFRTPDLLHFQSVFAFRLTLCQPHLLEENIGGIENTRSVSSISAFVIAELCQLARLNLRGFFVAVILGEQVAAELCCCYSGFA